MKEVKDIMLGKKVFHIKNTMPAFNSSEREAIKKQIANDLWQVLNRHEVRVN